MNEIDQYIEDMKKQEIDYKSKEYLSDMKNKTGNSISVVMRL